MDDCVLGCSIMKVERAIYLSLLLLFFTSPEALVVCGCVRYCNCLVYDRLPRISTSSRNWA